MTTETSSAVRSQHSTIRADARRAPRSAPDVEEGARELMTMAAHDLRSPLAAIKMRAHRIVQRWQAGEEPTSAEWAAVMFRVCRAADNGFSLIDDLLSMERLDRSGRPTSPRLTTDIGSVIEEAIAHQREAVDQARCKVSVIRQKGLERARGSWDRSYLLRVLGNLLRNAASHAPGAPVHITLSRRGDRLRLVFADRGPGLPPVTADPGEGKLDVGAELASHGLGLWIVRRAVERLHGRLRIHNRPGHGVAFDLELPGLLA